MGFHASPLALGQEVRIVDGAFRGCIGEIVKCPDGSEKYQLEEKWNAACEGDQYRGPARSPLADMYHVQTYPDPDAQIKILKKGCLVTFLQLDDIVSLRNAK
jgi:hypothetical protein